MSYQEGGNLSPHVSSISPIAVSNAGNETFTIEGSLFSPSMKVDVPSGLGTLVSVTITQPTSATSRAVIVVNVQAPTSTPTDYDITLSNGGESTANSKATVNLAQFTPQALILGSTDYWWNPDSLGATLSDGDTVASYPSSGGNHTLSSYYSSERPQYIHNHTWSTGKVASGTGMPPGPSVTLTRKFKSNIPLTNGPSGNIEGLTVGMVVKTLANTAMAANSAYPVHTYIGLRQLMRYRVGTSHGWSGAGYDSAWEDPNQNPIRFVFYIQSSATTKRMVFPQLNYDTTSTITAFSAPASNEISTFLGGSKMPTLFGECVVLNYGVSDVQLAQLQSYWTDKYGV